jgi:hypothetical protein
MSERNSDKWFWIFLMCIVVCVTITSIMEIIYTNQPNPVAAPSSLSPADVERRDK